MRCESVMQKVVFVATEDDTAQYVASVMRDENVGFLPVCDDAGGVVGAITDRDLAVRLCAEDKNAADTRVGEIMSTGVVTCHPGDELTDAERLMAEHEKSRIVVVDDAGTVVGVITLTDLVTRDSNQHAARTLRKIVAREARY